MLTKPINSVDFLSGGGEMGVLTRGFNWGDSPVGNPEDWPQSLRTIVAIILSSKFPMFLWWGEELLQFYNDAYRPSLGNQGKHPGTLGQWGRDCWPESWPTIKPLIDQVLVGGETTCRENQLISLYRNGNLENAYWTFSYSAVLTDTGHIGGVLVVCQETTQGVLNLKKLQQSEMRFNTIIKQSPMGIALLSGRDMIIEVANDWIYAMWRKDAHVIGWSFMDVMSELSGQRSFELLESVYDTGEPYYGIGERALMEREGGLQEAYFNLVYTPRRDTLGTITGVMVLATEVTSQKETERVLQQSRQREQDLDQLKSQFVSIASHEFRTPLTTIETSAYLIDQYLTRAPDIALPAIKKHLKIISLQIKTVDELLTDLLTLKTIEAEQVAFHPHWVDTGVFCQQVIDSHFSDRLDGRTVHFLQEGLPYATLLDEKLLGYALVSLLTNAFKYAKNNPCLLLRFSFQEVVIQVSDTGIGIPVGDLTALFQSFSRAGNAKDFSGAGLGLVIAREFVELHGGSLTVQSEVGLGSIFTIVLPSDLKK